MKQRDTLHNYTHITENKDHEIDWENKVILDKEIHFEKRKIKEAIYINAFDNGTLMNPDKGIPIYIYKSMLDRVLPVYNGS